MKKVRMRPLLVAFSALAVIVAGVLGISSSAFAEHSAKCGSVTMDENAWAGATANVYVLKYVLDLAACLPGSLLDFVAKSPALAERLKEPVNAFTGGRRTPSTRWSRGCGRRPVGAPLTRGRAPGTPRAGGARGRSS